MELENLVKKLTRQRVSVALAAKSGDDNLFFQEWKKLTNLFSESELKKIEILTRDQSKSDLWLSLRKDKLTGSIIGNFLFYHLYKKFEYGDKFILGHLAPSEEYKREMDSNPCIQHGMKNEAIAVQKFLAQNGHLFEYLNESGFVIIPQQPFIGISPDGYGEYSIELPEGLSKNFIIEIKCPCAKKFTIATKSDIENNVRKETLSFVKRTKGEVLMLKMGILRLEDKHYYKQLEKFAEPIDVSKLGRKVPKQIDFYHPYVAQTQMEMFARNTLHGWFIIFDTPFSPSSKYGKIEDKTPEKLYTILLQRCDEMIETYISIASKLYKELFIPEIKRIYRETDVRVEGSSFELVYIPTKKKVLKERERNQKKTEKGQMYGGDEKILEGDEQTLGNTRRQKLFFKRRAGMTTEEIFGRRSSRKKI